MKIKIELEFIDTGVVTLFVLLVEPFLRIIGFTIPYL